ncbi:MAG TPA: Pr6Pr family membrane protein [Candidatus Saccharimonadales bacterium]|nr:Pr6Pr family membrane protein [Candidatus Saccharimonadales bacterium]
MAKNKKLVAGYRLFFGALGVSAVATEIVVLVHRGTFVPANFFSFFTIESNIFAAAILLYGAFLHMSKRPRPSAAYDIVRGASVLYMAVTGIIFALLLSGLDAGVLTAVPWDNTVLHYLMPIAVCADWLLNPPLAKIRLKKALVWLVYPIVYLAYTLVRGNIVGWYPYPFLNVAENSYASIALVSVGIAVVAATLSWVITRVKRSGA